MTAECSYPVPAGQSLAGLVRSSRQHGVGRKGACSPRAAVEAPDFEPLEERLLLTNDIHSSFYTRVLLDMESLGQQPPPPIKINDFRDPPQVLPKSLTYTDKNGTHTYKGTAKAATWGDDPGWFGLPEDSYFHAGADAEATITNADGKHMVYADSNTSLEYYVDLEGGMTLPGDIMNVIRHRGYLSVPINITFRGFAKVDGTFDASQVTEAKARAVLIGTDGQTIYDNTCTATPSEPEAKFEDPVQAEIRFIPIFSLSLGHMYIYLQAATAATLQLGQGASGTFKCTAVADPYIAFDQAAFDAELESLGIPQFNLSDYFTLSYGDPQGFHTPMTISTPALAEESKTGPDDTRTGDHTPTFVGTVTDPLGWSYSMNNQLPAGVQLPPGVSLPNMQASRTKPPSLVVLYVDGAVAGRGKLTNPRYDEETGQTTFDYAVTACPMLDVTHSVMVAAGDSDASLTFPSDPLLLTIDGSQPLGNSATLALGVGGAKSITYTDEDGTTATLKLTAGAAQVTFEGDELGQIETAGGLVLTGEHICLARIALSGDTARGILSFSLRNAAGSDKQINVGSITSDNGLKSISGKGVNVWGDIQIGGPVGSLVLKDFHGPHTISLGGQGTDPSVTLSLGRVSDATLTSTIPIKALAATEWVDADGVADSITAPSLGAMTIAGAKASAALPGLAGDFSPDMTLTDGSLKATLGPVKVAGRLDGTWDILGNVTSIRAAQVLGSVRARWIGNMTSDRIDADLAITGTDGSGLSLKSLQAGHIASLGLSAAGGVGSISAADWQAGKLSAASVRSLQTRGNPKLGLPGDFGADLLLSGTGVGAGKLTLGSSSIAGNLQGATWQITGNMGNLTVGGQAGNSAIGEQLTVTTTGSMGAITLGAAVHADFLAGVDPSLGGDASITRRADNVLDFANAGARIKSVTVKGLKEAKGTPSGDYFVDSNFSAATIGATSIVDAVFNNDQAGLDETQDDFGLWALTIGPVRHRNLAARIDPFTNWLWTPAFLPPPAADDLHLSPMV